MPGRLESLEDRTMLSVSIPPTIDPTKATQVLFAGDLTQEALPAGTPTRLWEFSLNGATSPASIQFDLGPTSSSSQDGALALYDADGNLLSSVNANPTPSEPGIESLVAPVQSGQVYILGTFLDPSVTQNDFQLTVTPDPQNLNAPLTADSSTGNASLPVNSGQTLFQSPADVEVYPVNLPNGGATGSVVVTAADPNAGVDATLFRRDNAQSPWVPIANTSGTGALMLALTPAQGESLADSNFQLAVAPLNFSSAAGAYQIDVTSATLAPTSVDPTTAVQFSNVLLPAIGTVRYASADSLAGASKLYEYDAPSTGQATITLANTGFAPLVSVYDAAGTKLMKVQSLTSAGTLSFQIPVTAGSKYLIRVDGVGGAPTGSTQLTVDASYTPSVLSFGSSSITSQKNIAVGPTAGAAFFQINPTVGTDVLAIEVDGAAAGASIEVTVIGPGFAPVTVQGAAGQPVYLPASITGKAGPYDIAISSTTDSQSLELQLGQLALPTQIDPSQLKEVDEDLTGHVGQSFQLADDFGKSAGLVYYQFLTDPADPTTITAQGNNGARPVLARYADIGGVLRLVAFATPNAQGLASLNGPLVSQARQGLMTFLIGFPGSQSPVVQVAVAAPKPVAVQVGMAPNNPPPLPSQPNPTPTLPFESQLKIDQQTLNADFQQQLFQTILPYNLVFNAANLPILTFTPSTPASGLQANVTVYRADTMAVVATATSNSPGQTLNLTLYSSAAHLNALKGVTLLILVKPIAGHLGDGIYSLDLNVQTTDPRPFLVTQDIWQFQPAAPNTLKPLKNVGDLNANTSVGVIPAGVPITPILQNQLGNGVALGQFTSSDPTNAGTYAVYEFWTMTPGPIIVRTVPIQDNANDPIVNTSIRVYRGLNDANGQFFLDRLAQTLAHSTNYVTGDFDWYPASLNPLDPQSEQNQFPVLNPDDPDIASQVYINNSTVITQGDPKGDTYGNGGGAYYVVVRNQQGTQGKYRVEVDTPSFPLLGGTTANNAQLLDYKPAPGDPNEVTALNNQITYLNDANGGSATLHLNYVANFTDFVGYFPIEISADSQGPLTITTPKLVLNDTLWNFSLFDANGQQIPGTSTDNSYGFAKNTTASFQIPAGAQIVYLRAQVRPGDPIPKDDGQFTLSTALNKGVVQPPPTTFPASETPVMFSTDPMGNAQQTAAHDGTLTDAFSIFDSEQSYTFQAGAGPIAVTLTPVSQLFSGGQWRIGVYVGSTLLDWSVAALGSPTTLNLTLPTPRQPTDDSASYGYDRSAYQQVTIRVERLNNAAIGTFSLAVKTSAAYPMQNQAVPISPLTGGSSTVSTNGLGWNLIQVPEDNMGAMQLTGIVTNVPANGEQVHYDVYDFTGNFVASGQTNITQAIPIASFQVPNITGGHSYFVRIGLTDSPTTFIKFAAGVNLPKALDPSHAKPAASIDYAGEPILSAPVYPNGIYGLNIGSSDDEAFWVDQDGVAEFKLSTGFSNDFLALYRLDYSGHGEDINEWTLDLVDYLNRTDVKVGLDYDLTANVEPGVYIVKVAPNVGAPLYGTLPAYIPHPLVVDPSTGSAEYPNLEGTDTANGRQTPVDAYRTTVFSVVAPAAATGLFQAKAKLLSTEDSYISGKAFLEVYTPDGISFDTVTPQPGKGDNTILSDPGNKGDEANPAQVTDLTAKPFQTFYISLSRQFVASEDAVTADFDVPASGTPDLVVEPLVLTPNDGQTLVTVTIVNNGYGKANASTARYAFSDAAQPASLQWTTSILNEDSLGPLGSRSRTFVWNPVTANDVVEYTTDFVSGKPNGNIQESDETNNGPYDINTAPNGANPRILKEVDTGPPSVTMQLGDKKLEGPEVAQGIWGRYISNVSILTSIVFNFTDPDGTSDLWSAYGHYPSIVPQVKSTVGQYLSQTGLNNDPQIVIQNYDLGQLLPTAPDNTNQINISATDQWGLTSPVISATLNVVPKPGWLTNSESTITFDSKKYDYDIHFHHTILNEEGTLNDLLNTNLPLVGDKQNQLLAEVDAKTTATLDPTKPIAAPLTAHAKLELLGSTIFDETWKGNAAPADHFTITTNVQIDPATVEAKFFEITFALTNLPLANFASPEIPLFAYGVPGIADIEADLQFLFQASLSAAVTIAINPSATTAADFLGLASPTYVGPSATVGAKVSGNVKILGFSIASLSGTVDVQLNLDYGLTTPHDQFVPFGDFFNDSGFKVSGDLYGVLEADFLGFKVWSYTTPSIQLFSSGNVVTNTTGGGSPDDNQGTETIPKGSDPLGPLSINPDPQMVIDPKTGRAMYVQVVNVGPTTNPQGNLAFAQRVGGNWSSLVTIPESSYVANPVLAETFDGTGDLANSANVVVYQAADLPANVTRSQYLAAQDIRYRYFNGRSWSAEQTLSTGNANDSEPAVSFNRLGQGVAAWVHNTDSNPIGDDGQLDDNANEIQVAVWNKATHSFSSPLTLTNDNVDDDQPTVLAGADGTLRVAWVRATAGGGNQVWYSTYNGSQWSNPAQLQTTGLPQNGVIQDIALGQDGAGNIHTMIAERSVLANGTADWQLLDRITPQGSWTAPATLETVSTGAHFSQIQMTTDSHGNLVAYWQQSNGIDNNAWAASYVPTPSSGKPAWSTPYQVTNNPDAAIEPTLAVDTDGKLQVAYDHQVPLGSQAGGNATDPTITGLAVAGGVMTGSITPLPEFSFTRPMSFPYQSNAAGGTQATADAEIINRGIVASDVTIEFFNGLPQGGTLLGSETVHLSPGQSFDVQHPFTVLPGGNTYSIFLVAPGGKEEITTADDTSSATLDGLADLTVSSVTLSDPTPHSGETVNVSVLVSNLSNIPVNAPFGVTLTQGNPAHAFETTVPLGSKTVQSLGAFGQTILVFPWTVPAAGGNFNLTALVDPANAIKEAVETNNDGHADVVVQANATVSLDTPTLLNKSGKNNVSLVATVTNTGTGDLQNVPVELLWSLNNAPFQVAATFTVASLPAGEHTTITYDAVGLAGQNHYRVVVDPTSASPDADRSNNVADQYLTIQGLADLIVSQVALARNPIVQGVPDTVTALVSNIGIAGADNVTVEVFEGTFGTYSAPAKLLASTVIGHIDPLSSTMVSIPIDTAGLTPGRHQFTVYVDRKQTILEVLQTNNTATAIFNVVPGEHIPPASAVTLLPAVEPNPTFTVSWTGKDNPGGSGIAYYDIYESTNGTPATLWISHTTATSAVFSGKVGNTYAFYSIATDNAGNREAPPKAPDTTTRVDVAPTITKTTIEMGMTQRSYVDQFQIQFSGPVNIGSLIDTGMIVGAITLTNLGANVPASTPHPVTLSAKQFRYNANTHTLTWSLEAFGAAKTSLPDGYYLLTVDGSKITDAFGTKLDGNGDGQPGGMYTTHFFRLAGDVTGNMKVDASTAAGSDLSIVNKALGSMPSSRSWNANADLNRDGKVNSLDVAIVKNNNGHAIVLPKMITKSATRSSVTSADSTTTQPAFVAGTLATHPAGPQVTFGTPAGRGAGLRFALDHIRVARQTPRVTQQAIRSVRIEM
jgi:hypothetical protein